jgi:hypothetical protein
MWQLRPWQFSPAACLGNGSQGGPRYGRVFSARKPRPIAFVGSDTVPKPFPAPSATRPAAARARAIDVAEFLCASRRLQRDQQVLDQIVRMLEAA